MIKAALFCKNGPTCPDLKRVFSPERRKRIASRSSLLPTIVTRDNFESLRHDLRHVDVIFATWGMWDLLPEQLNSLENLKAVFYAAGTVKYFAVPMLQRGVVVSSASAANAVPVAEFTLAEILLANKGYFRNVDEYSQADEFRSAFRGRGNYGATVSILGAGAVGRRVIEFLRPFHLKVLVFDPFLSHKHAEMIGAEKVERLEDAFSRGDIVSNHLADLPPTYGLIRASHFGLMPRNATFINTGRGRTVDHDGMLAFLLARPDVTALLDVTDPEPLPRAHPLRALPNLRVSGHIAGSIGDEVGRMGDLAIEEFERWRRGEPIRHGVSLEQLETMA